MSSKSFSIGVRRTDETGKNCVSAENIPRKLSIGLVPEMYPKPARIQKVAKFIMAEVTGTLADSLLEDLDDLSDDDDGDYTEEKQLVKEQQMQATNENEQIIEARRKLTSDSSLLDHLNDIRQLDEYTTTDHKQQEDYEHQLVTTANKHLFNLAQELARAHLDLCHAYAPKFPELQELIVDPLQYKNAVCVISNEMDVTKVNDQLNDILGSNQIITISVAASTTSGRPLSDTELQQVLSCANYMNDIIMIQKELTNFVESRMSALAPSICALVGPSTAAKLVGIAGGLGQLSKIPACNLQVLGQIKQNATSKGGMSNASSQPHVGILVECDLVQSVPSYLQKKALKVVAAKLALSVRCDFVNVDTGRTRSAKPGIAFRQEILTKIMEWQTPHKAQVLKALPK